MGKFIVSFYNRFACQNQMFGVIADDEDNAERIFWIKHNRDQYLDCIEGISEFVEESFYEEELKSQEETQ